MTATCSKPLDKRPKEAGLEGHHPTCSRLGSGKDTHRTVGGPRVQVGWRQLCRVGSVGLREAVLIYCCSEAPLLASGHKGTSREERAGGEPKVREQRRCKSRAASDADARRANGPG